MIYQIKFYIQTKFLLLFKLTYFFKHGELNNVNIFVRDFFSNNNQACKTQFS